MACFDVTESATTIPHIWMKIAHMFVNTYAPAQTAHQCNDVWKAPRNAKWDVIYKSCRQQNVIIFERPTDTRGTEQWYATPQFFSIWIDLLAGHSIAAPSRNIFTWNWDEFLLLHIRWSFLMTHESWLSRFMAHKRHQHNAESFPTATMLLTRGKRQMRWKKEQVKWKSVFFILDDKKEEFGFVVKMCWNDLD